MNQIETVAIRHEKVYESMGTRRQPPKPEHSLCPSFAFKGNPTPFRPNRRSFLKAQAAHGEEIQVEYDDEDPEYPTEHVDVSREFRPKPGRPTGHGTESPNPATKLAWRAVLLRNYLLRATNPRRDRRGPTPTTSGCRITATFG